MPALQPGESEAGTCGRRFRITRILEALAEQSDDLGEQIAVCSRDLSHGCQFLRIAELCFAHDPAELALEWAERGLAAFPERPDPLELSWLDFADRPSLEAYQRIKADAERLGEWDARRTASLDLLRERATPSPRSLGASPRPLGVGPHLPLGG